MHSLHFHFNTRARGCRKAVINKLFCSGRKHLLHTWPQLNRLSLLRWHSGRIQALKFAMTYLPFEMVRRFNPLSEHSFFKFLNRGYIDFWLNHLSGWLFGLFRHVIKVRVVLGRRIQVSYRCGGSCRSWVSQLRIWEYLRMLQGWQRPL